VPPFFPPRALSRVPAAMLATCLATSAAAASLGPDTAPCDSNAASGPQTFEAVFRAAAPAVVRVLSLRYRTASELDLPAEILPPPAIRNGQKVEPIFAERSAASGFIVSPDGLILGSEHAVHEAAETWVELNDGRQFRARPVGFDPRLDLALLKIDARGLPVLSVAAADPRPGQWVAAIGAPFGFEHSMSAGIVSAFPRELPAVAGVGLIQTDVAVNPGSSGGPLLNACGQVIGMSAMVFSTQGVYAGITFAIPGRRLLQAAAALRDGRVRHGSAGLLTQSLTPPLARAFGLPSTAGALVAQVEPGGAAAEAGVREGDVVLALQGIPMPNADALEERLDAVAPGQRLPMEVWRDGARRPVELRLHAANEPPAARHAIGVATSRLGLVFGSSGGQGGGPEKLRVIGSDGAAMLAGVEEGDVIAAVNGQPVTVVQEFDRALAAANAAGAPTVALLVVRDGVRAYLAVHTNEEPAASTRRQPTP
jgi:serine protease Do